MCYICDHLKKDFQTPQAKYEIDDGRLLLIYQDRETIIGSWPVQFCSWCGEKIKKGE